MLKLANTIELRYFIGKEIQNTENSNYRKSHAMNNRIKSSFLHISLKSNNVCSNKYF